MQKKKIKSPSLGGRIIAIYAGISFFLALIIASSVYISLRNFQLQAMTENHRTIASTMGGRIHQLMDSFPLLMTLVAKEYEDWSREDKADVRLKEIVIGNRYIERIEVINSEGQVLHSSQEGSQAKIASRTGEPFIDFFVDKDAPYWSKLFISPNTGEPTIQMVLHYHETYFAAYLNLEELSTTSNLYASDYNSRLSVILTDPYGIYLSAPDKKLVTERHVSPDIDTVQALVNGQIAHAQTVYYGKPAFLSAYRVEKPLWYVLVYQDRTDLMKAVWQPLSILIAAMLLLFVIGSFLYIRQIQSLWRIFNGYLLRMNDFVAGKRDLDKKEEPFAELEHINKNFRAMSEQIIQRETDLLHRASHDSLTGVYNRMQLMMDMDQQVDNNTPFSLIYLNIERFHLMNDTHGHAMGDRILTAVAQRLSQLTEKGTAYRIGGDEFAVMLDASDGAAYIQQIADAQNEPFFINGTELFVPFNGSLVNFPEDVDSRENVTKLSAIAIMMAKRAHCELKNILKAPFRFEAKKYMQIEHLLKDALHNNEFILHFQPQIDTVTGNVVGMETLTRWTSKTIGVVPPDLLFLVAEDSSMAHEITRWILVCACEEMLRLNRHFGSAIRISVNIPPSSFGQADFSQQVKRILQKTGLPPTQLELELTETAMVNSISVLHDQMLQLREIGVRIAVDDFGKGYSSLEYIGELPIDTLKVDKVFIRKFTQQPFYRSIMQFILRLGEELKLDIVAEGVETQDEFFTLQRMGKMLIQGYYHSYPLPVEKLQTFLETQKLEMEKKDIDTFVIGGSP